MTENTGLIAREDNVLDLALLKAVGLDRVAPEQRQLAINIAQRYDLDLLLKHLVLIEGRPYVTRDALLHIAHRSGQFDGIEVTQPVVVDGYWRCEATVYRKDMSHPFRYPGRYPEKGGNAKFAEEMAIKVAESMALRRAFNVAAPVVEERWDVDAPAEAPPPRPTLRERAAEKAAAIPPETLAAAAPAVFVQSDVPEPPAAVPAPRGAFSAAALASLARDAGKTKHEVATAIAMIRGGAVPTAAEVSDIVKAMSDEERRLLAVELNLDAGGAA